LSNIRNEQIAKNKVRSYYLTLLPVHCYLLFGYLAFDCSLGEARNKETVKAKVNYQHGDD
jgi:hypothetical protein